MILLTEFETLLDRADDENVEVFIFKFKTDLRGIVKNIRIGLNSNLTLQERTEELYHELAHLQYSTRDLINYWISNDSIKKYIVLKEERYIMEKVFNYFIDINLVVEKAKYCRNDFELAEELNVSEHLLKEYLKYHVDEVNRLIKRNKAEEFY